MEEKLKQFALQNGAHIIGFADAAAFIDAPEGFSPMDIMAIAKSVIVLGIAMAKGTVFSDNQCVYTVQGEVIVRELDILANKMAFFIEQQGGAAIPIPTDAPYFHWEEERKYGRGIFSHRHAAVQAGLGLIGKSSMFLHPKFGSRITLVSVLTDLVLSTEPLQTEVICPPACRRCIENCPVGALNGDGTIEQKLCRSNAGTKSARGHELINCWNCRIVCPQN